MGPDAATLRGLLRHMPNHAAAHRALKARMRDSRLALCKCVLWMGLCIYVWGCEGVCVSSDNPSLTSPPPHKTKQNKHNKRWKKACEGGGAQTDPNAMKDYKTLPFLRRAVNVIAPPDRVTTAEEAVSACVSSRLGHSSIHIGLLRLRAAVLSEHTYKTNK